MLSIQALTTVRRRFAGLPEFTAIGLLALAIGGAADVLTHVLNAPFLVFDGIDRSEAVAHALVVAGVALTLGGLVVAAIGLRRSSADDTKGAIGTPKSDF